jgi:type III pantothenate kinase
MTLAVDIGNTNITFGVFEDATLTRTFRLLTHSVIDSANPSLPNETFELTKVVSIGIASVVPNATEPVRSLLHRQFPSANISVLRNTDIPIINRYRHPEQTGIDRLLASLAAYRMHRSLKRPLVVIDLGTATTIDCISMNGEYLGGIITLGIGASAEALSSLTVQLPKIELQFPNHVLGRSTVESMQSGILYGALSSVEGLTQRLSQEVFPNESPLVVATGGLADLLKERTNSINSFESQLVLKGIVITMSSL